MPSVTPTCGSSRPRWRRWCGKGGGCTQSERGGRGRGGRAGGAAARAAASEGMVDVSGGAAGGPPRVLRLDRASDYVTPDDTVRHLAFMCALIKATNRFIAVAAAAAETA